MPVSPTWNSPPKTRLGDTPAVFYQVCFGSGQPDTSKAPRIMLHAAELGFEHPVTGEQLLFEMPPPEDFGRFLEGVRKRGK